MTNAHLTLTTRVLLALIAGLLAGVAIAALGVPALRTAAAGIFALAMTLVVRTGLGAVRALAFYR